MGHYRALDLGRIRERGQGCSRERRNWSGPGWVCHHSHRIRRAHRCLNRVQLWSGREGSPERVPQAVQKHRKGMTLCRSAPQAGCIFRNSPGIRGHRTSCCCHHWIAWREAAHLKVPGGGVQCSKKRLQKNLGMKWSTRLSVELGLLDNSAWCEDPHRD